MEQFMHRRVPKPEFVISLADVARPGFRMLNVTGCKVGKIVPVVRKHFRDRNGFSLLVELDTSNEVYSIPIIDLTYGEKKLRFYYNHLKDAESVFYLICKKFTMFDSTLRSAVEIFSLDELDKKAQLASSYEDADFYDIAYRVKSLYLSEQFHFSMDMFMQEYDAGNMKTADPHRILMMFESTIR